MKISLRVMGSSYWFLLILSLVATPTLADTENDVWNVTVSILPRETFRTQAIARAEMKASSADAAFLEFKTQRNTKYGDIYTDFRIPPQDLAEWDPWSYGILTSGCSGPSEQAAIDCYLENRNPCGLSTVMPTTPWYSIETSYTFQREERLFDATIVGMDYDPEIGFYCPGTPNTTQVVMWRHTNKWCPAEPPWNGDPPHTDGLCHNDLTAIITDRELLQGCVAEDDGRDAVDGNPCDAGTGNKLEREPDYQSSTLSFVRHYNSNDQMPAIAGFGSHWSHEYAMRLVFASGSSGPPYMRVRADGQGEMMQLRTYPTKYVGERSGAQLIEDASDEWDLHLPDGSKHHYDSSGKLIWTETAVGQRTTLTYGSDGLSTITGPFGHQITLTYTDGRISKMTDPDGQEYLYSYTSGVLGSVVYPDSTQRTYHYENALPFELTGITDENGDRYSTFDYDSAGRVILTEHAGGYEKYTLVYNADTSTTVTDALSNSTTYEFASMTSHGKFGRRRPTTFTRDGQTFSRAYTTGNYVPHRPATVTDENGSVTKFAYHYASYQRTSKTEAFGTPNVRVTTYSYLNAYRNLLTEIESDSVYSSADKTLTIAYDANQRPITVTLSGRTPSGTTVSRATSLDYNSYDQIIEIDGPRTDVSDITTLTYYECTTGAECGQLESITNAVGHETTFDDYDDHGRLLEMTDPNNVVTTYTYDLRGRVTSVTETPPSGPARETTYEYDDAGQLEEVTTPNGMTLAYEYDEAHNLLSVTDNLGNKIEYSYDLNGNLTGEDYLDPSETLKKTLSYTYDARNRIEEINSAGSITDLVFDALGNLTDETDP